MNRPRTLGSKVAWAIFAITFLIRLLVIARLTEADYFLPTEGDMKFYQDWALRILRGHWNDGYAFYGLPGYAFLIAGIYKLLGSNPFYLSALQGLAEAFVAYLIVKIAFSLFREEEKPFLAISVGALAGLGYAFFVPAQTYSVILMPTSLVVALLWFLVLYSMESRANLPKYFSVAGLGLLIGLMAMMVATIFFGIPLVIASFWRGCSRATLINWMGRAIALLIFVVLGASPAMFYNRFVARDPVMLSAHSGLNFFIGNNPIANGYPKIPDELRSSQAGMLQDSIRIAEKALGKKVDEKIPRSAVSAYWSAQASQFIREHPFQWAKLIVQKIINFWNAYEYDDLTIINALSTEGITTPGLRFGIVSAFGLAGMIFSWFSFPRSRWVAGAVMLHLGSLLTVFVTERYRMAAVPGLLLFGAILIVCLWEAIRQSLWLRATGNVALLAISTLFATLPSKDTGMLGLEAFNAGVRNLAAGKLDLAKQNLQLAWRYKPENDETNFGLGNLYLAQNENQAAKVFYRRALEIEPNHTGAYNNLGFIALEEKHPKAAIQFYRRSVEIDSTSLIARHQLAQAFFANQQLQEADTALKKALELNPDHQPSLLLQTKIADSLYSLKGSP